MDDLIDQYLRNKYGEDYQKKAESDYASSRDNINTGSIMSSLGAALANRDPNSSNDYYNQLKKQAKDDTVGMIVSDKSQFVKDKMDASNLSDLATKQEMELAQRDPNARQSLIARALAKKYNLPVQDTDSYKDVSQFMDPKKMMETEAASNVDFSKQAQLRKMDQGFREKESNLDRNLKRELDDKNDKVKAAEKGEKNKQAMNEINDRYTNMKSNISELKKLIDQTGGGDITGSENKAMDQYIEAIATDMAKLVDPSSVARESEVASFKRMLFEPGVLNNLFTRGSTIQKTVQNFENMLDKRLDTAYKVRGLEKPQQLVDTQQQSKAQSVMSDEDRKAYDWAMQNPDNPKSEQIIQKLQLKMAGN